MLVWNLLTLLPNGHELIRYFSRSAVWRVVRHAPVSLSVLLVVVLVGVCVLRFVGRLWYRRRVHQRIGGAVSGLVSLGADFGQGVFGGFVFCAPCVAYLLFRGRASEVRKVVCAFGSGGRVLRRVRGSGSLD